MPRIFFVLMLVIVFVPATLAQDDGDDEAPTIATQIEQIERNTEILRDLQPQQDVPVLFPSRDAVRDFLNAEFEEAYLPETVEELMAFYVAFDFLPPDFDLREAVVALYSQQVIGYYDPDTTTMNLVTRDGETPTGNLLLLDRVTYSHEYVHALQDQYFDLAAYQDEVMNSTNYDSNLAYQSLIEGDATFVMNEYTRQATEANPLAAMVELGVGLLDAGSITLPAGTPDIFEAELLFPYLGGEGFVRALFADGGWDRVNNAYTDLPMSSEHILHPETYLKGDMPHEVELPAIAPDGWEVALSGTLGEFYLRQWLDTQFISNAPIDLAASGWGGDTFNIYRNDAGDLAWELRLSWDTPEDADEFGTVIQDFAELRLPESASTLGDLICWSGEAALCVAYIDATTIDVTFAPTAEIAGELLN